MWRRLSPLSVRERPRSAPPLAPSLHHLTPGLQSGGLAHFRVAKQRSGMPVAVGNFFSHRGQMLDQSMVRREMADRIGGAGVARDQEGLAAAAAEILLAAGGAFSRRLP